MTMLAALLMALMPTAPADSMRTTDIEEVVVVSAPKENQRLRQQPVASASFAQTDMIERGVAGVKDLSAHVPNLYIPAYGSRLTTSMYLRGIGSRTGSPAVALYVDGVPQLSSASYDLSFSNVDRIDVLRGPQSTMYGRNALGGVVRVYTKNPMHYQGSDIRLEGSHVAGGAPAGRGDGGGAGRYKLNLTHYHRISSRFAFSGHLFGVVDGGYFRNEARADELIDWQRMFGARMRFIIKPHEALDLDLAIGHEWLNQGGYPYEYVGAVGSPTTPNPPAGPSHIAYDNASGYRRSLTNAGLTAERRWPRVVLTSVTGFQHLHDRMDLDQDFTPRNLYTLMQRQNQNTLSEEVVLKKRNSPLTPPFGGGEGMRRVGTSAASTLATAHLDKETQGAGCSYSWLFGLNAIRQWSSTDGPVAFHADGLGWLNGLINRQANAHMPAINASGYTMAFNFDNQVLGSDLAFPGTYDMPVTNLALFHQSSLQNLFGLEGLHLTAGLRLDYERLDMSYDTHYGFDQRYMLSGHLTYPDGQAPRQLVLVPTSSFRVDDGLAGSLHTDYLQLLPRVALQWAPAPGPASDGFSYNLYASVARGYRSGGYNNQMFGDLLQARMQTRILQNVTSVTLPVVREQPSMPEVAKATVEQILTSMSADHGTDVQGATWYRPQSSWNYEVGAHLNLPQARLLADVAAFLTDTRNQQVSRMSSGGLGRVTTNSGRSRSIGAEASLRYYLTDNMLLNAAYGYTHARFREGSAADGAGLPSARVPFVPEHTLSVGATQTWPVRRPHLAAISLHADYCGAGSIYWTDESDAHQPFAGQLNARLSFDIERLSPHGTASYATGTKSQRRLTLSLWATNILSQRYQTFYFETMQRGFAQYTRPVALGAELRWRL